MEKPNAMVLAAGASDNSYREYRRGNWTPNETMILIEAKTQDSKRRMKRSKESDEEGAEGSVIKSRSQEMRWKWVEEYCWQYGCYRSQNQCNDRWDNLMRDYKKVRTYEFGAEGHDHVSYWSLERHERKRRSLPCNMLPEIYQALTKVAHMRGGVERGSAGVLPMAGLRVEERREREHSCSMPLIPHSSPIPVSNATEPPTSTPLATIAASDSRECEHSDSHERKRKREESISSRSDTNDLTSAISKCALVLAEAMQTCQQREDQRHTDLVKIEERKAQIDSSRTETSVQSMHSLATAINKLASSILGLVTDKGSTRASK